jgi:hypothetical protein
MWLYLTEKLTRWDLLVDRCQVSSNNIHKNPHVLSAGQF